MQYNFNEIEANWQQYWAENKTFQAQNNSEKPKYYVLDMFPYPSGAGLHVGHPLGYIASDIYARYKRHQGFNVLHPQGYDSFGLPAEQYAIQTGQHPAVTTATNIKRYREQLDKIGFSFDWSREVRTSNADYYKHTQWIFIQLFNSWYNKDTNKAEDIATLIAVFETSGNTTVNADCDADIISFSVEEWNAFNTTKQQEILLQYRLTFLAETEVNWCPKLGTVLANDEIVNGVSERGGHEVVRKKMTQWSMRISAYADRLLNGIDYNPEALDWTDSIKEIQRNWIGKSVGAEVTFKVLSPTLSEGKEATKGYMTGGSNSHLLLERAKEMRANPTQAEGVLWQQLKSKKLGIKIRQQHLIEDFIVDFVCLSKKLIVEVDGKIHENQVEKDAERTAILETKGYKVIRFTNEEVIDNVDSVVAKIEKELKNRQEVLPSGKDLGWDIEVFTTRPDTIFGVSFLTLAPEHELVSEIVTNEQKEAVNAYITATAKRSERERMADVKTISGVFTGAYAEHPFTKKLIPIWIGDYVLASYGTGAVMAVPCGDQRDYDFAKHFNIEIPNILEGVDISEQACADKTVKIANSDFLNGLKAKKAGKLAIYKLEELGQGKGKTQYRLRDAVFSRQRYWGEPFPVYYKDGMPQMIDAKHLPIALPEVEKYLPTETGEPPLGNATVWAWNTKKCAVVSNQLINEDEEIYPLELNTMPGWAGSSWYLFRYMDAQNETEFASKKALDYWQNVDLYIGGSEHATGHLLYSRFWTKFLHDRGFVGVDEPFKKMINQGMILGTSAFVYRISAIVFDTTNVDFQDPISNINFTREIFISKDFISKCKNLDNYDKQTIANGFLVLKLDDELSFQENQILNFISDEDRKLIEANDKYAIAIIKNPLHVDVSLVNASDELDVEGFRNHPLNGDYRDAIFIGDNGEVLPFGEDLGGDSYTVGREVEKMSKSKYNVVNPDEISEQYGADTLRLYEMFLGPLEQAKPWNTAGITGVHNFLKKMWKLYVGEDGLKVTDAAPTKDNLKTLHKTIKKVTEDIERFSFNTSVSTFMICVNELTAQKCTSKVILQDLAVLISPYAPHIAEELWSRLGNNESISTANFPEFDAKHLVESSKNYPISFNGKTKFTMELSLDLTKDELEKIVMEDERTIKILDGKTPKKVIVVPGKIINLVG